jgi:hypothetical protein
MGTMKKAGGIIALIAGIFAIGTTFANYGIDIFIAGPGGMRTTGVDSTARLFWGILCSFLTITLGAILIGIDKRSARRQHAERRHLRATWPGAVLIGVGRRIPGILIIVCAVTGAMRAGELVAVFMVLATIGGVVAILPDFRA